MICIRLPSLSVAERFAAGRARPTAPCTVHRAHRHRRTQRPGLALLPGELRGGLVLFALQL